MARRGRTPRTPRAYRGSEAEAFKEMLDESLQPKLPVKDRANALRRVILERERAFSNWMGDSEIRFPSDPVARKRSESLLKRFYLGERVPDSALYLRRGMSDEGYQELVDFVSSIPWDRPMPGLYSEHSPLSEKGRQALKQLTEHYARRALDFQFDHRMPGLEAGDVPSAAMLSMMETIARYREPNSLEMWYSNERLVSDFERELDMGVRRTLSQMNQQAREIEQNEVQAGFAEDEDDIYSTLGPTPSRESGGLPAHLRGLANEPLSSIVPAFGKLDPLQRQNFRAFVQSVGFDPDKVTFSQAYQMRQLIKETGFHNANDVMRPMLRGPKTGGLENEWRRFDTVVRNAGQAATLYSQDSETIRDLRRQLYGEEETQSAQAWEDEIFELEDDTSFTKIYPHLLPSGQDMTPIVDRMWRLWKRFAKNYRGQLGKQDLLSIDEARYYIGGTNALLHQAGAHYPDVRKVADALTKLAGMEQGALDKYLTVPNYTADDPSGSVTYLPLSEYEQLYQDELDLLDDLSDRGLRESSLSEIESLTRSDLEQERIAATPENAMPEPMTLEHALHGPREERAKQFRAFRNVMAKRQEVWQHPGDIDAAVGGGGGRLVQWPGTYSRSEDSLSVNEQVAAAYQRGDLFYREADAISSLRAAYEAWLDTQYDPDVGPAAFREFARQRGVRVDVLDRMLHSQGGAPVLSPEEVLQLMEEGALPSQRVFEPDEPAATEEPEPAPFTPEPLPTWRVSTAKRAPIPKAKEPARQPRPPGRPGKPVSSDSPGYDTLPEDRFEELSAEAKRAATPVTAQRETADGEVSPDSFLVAMGRNRSKSWEGRVRRTRSHPGWGTDPGLSLRRRRTWYASPKPNRGANEEPPPPDWDKISDADAPPDPYADEFYDPRGTLRNQQDQGWETPPQRAQGPRPQRSEPPENVAGKPIRPQYAAHEQDDGSIRWKKRDSVDERVWHDVDESEVPSYVRDPNDPNYDPNAAFRHESGWLAMQRALAREAEEEATSQASPPVPEAARQADPAPEASRQRDADAESGKSSLPEYIWTQGRGRKRWYKRDPSHPAGWREVDTKDVPSRVRDPKDPDYDESLSFGWDLEIKRTRWSNWIQEGDTEYRYNISGWDEEERWQSRPAEGGRPSYVDAENVPDVVRQKRQDAFSRAQAFNESQKRPLLARIESGEVDPDTGELLEDRGIALRVGLLWQAKREIHEERTKSDDPEAKLDSVHRAVGLRYAGALLEAEDPRYWGPARREKTGLNNRGLDRAFHIASEAIYSALESGSPNLDDADWLAELVHKVRTSIRDQILKETKALDQRGGGSRADRDLLAQINDAAAEVAKSFFNSLGEILGQGGAGVSAYQAAVSRLYDRTTSLHGKHQADLLAQMYETDERFQRAVDARGGLERVKREGAYIPSSALSDDPNARDLVIQGAGDALGGGRAGFGLGGRGNPYAAIRAWYALRALKGVFDLTFAQGSQDMAQAVDFTNAVSAAIGEGQSQLGIWANQTANRQIASGIAAYQNFGFAYDAANQVLGDVGAARLTGGLRFAAGVGVSGPIASAISAMAGMGTIPGLGWATAIAGLALGTAYVGNEVYNALTGEDRGLGERIGDALGLKSSIPDKETRAYREQLAIARAMGWDANRGARLSFQATRLYGSGAGGWTPDFSQVDITGTPGYQQIIESYKTPFQQRSGISQVLAVGANVLYWSAGKIVGAEPSEPIFLSKEDFQKASIDTTVGGQSIFSLQNVVQQYGIETGLGDEAFKFLSDMAAALYPVDYRAQRDLVHFSALRQDYDQDLETSYWAQITEEMRQRVAATLFDQDAANEFIESLLPVGTTDLRQIAAVDAASRYVGSAAAYGIDFRHKGEQIVSSILSGDVTLEQSAVHSELFSKQLAMGAPAWLAYANIDPTLPVDQQQALFAGIQQQYELTGTYRAIADPERYLAMTPGARRSWHELQAQAQRYGGDIWDIQAVQEDFVHLKGFQRESLPTLYAAYQRGGGTPEEVARQAISSVAGLTPEQVAGQEAIAAALYAANQQFSVLDLRRWSQAVTLPEARRLSEGIAQMESAGFSGTGITNRLASLVAQTSGTDFASALELSELYSAMGLSGVGMDFIEEAGRAGTEASQAVSRITQWQRAIGLSPRRAQVQGFQMGMRFSDPLSASLYLEMGDLAFAATGDPIAALRFAEEAPGMDLMTRRYYQGIMRGDQWQLSRMARLYPELGLTPFFTESGHDTFWERGLALDDRQWALSTQSRQFQLGMGQEQFAQQQAMTFGGTFFNPVTGQMQTLQYGRLDIQDALFDLSVRQQRYYLDYQQRQLDASNQYQAQQMQRNWEQMQMRFDWRIADWQYGENVSQLQFAWSMEDYDENIRFATGRQRRLLMRQRDRAVIQETMRRGHSEEQRERIDIEREWAREAHEAQRQYFEENKSLQQERLERERQFFEERLVWQNREREMSRLSAELENNRQQRELQHQNWMLQQEQALHNEQRQMKIDQANMVAEWRFFMETQMPNWLRSISTNLSVPSSGSGSYGNQPGYQMPSAPGMGGGTPSSGMNTSGKYYYSSKGPVRTDQYDPNESGGMTAGEWYQWRWLDGMPHFRSGGYTGDGLPDEIAGLAHKGEWVVPEHGALVVRGDNPETVAILKQIHAVLAQIASKGIANLTFNYSGRDFQSQMNYARDLLDRTYQ